MQQFNPGPQQIDVVGQEEWDKQGRGKTAKKLPFNHFDNLSAHLIGVDCRDRLAEEHIEADMLADSQCWTSAFRRASSKAISVSLVES